MGETPILDIPEQWDPIQICLKCSVTFQRLLSIIQSWFENHVNGAQVDKGKGLGLAFQITVGHTTKSGSWSIINCL